MASASYELALGHSPESCANRSAARGAGQGQDEGGSPQGMAEADQPASGTPALDAAGALAWAAYSEHATSVWRTLRRLGVSPANLDDAVQDVFLTVQRRAAEFRGESQLRTWVLGIAVRVALNARRNAQRFRNRFVELPDEPMSSLAAPDELAAEREAVHTAHALLARLSDDQRTLLVLVDLEQLSVADAAEILELNPSTTYKRLDVARKRFSAELERHQKRERWRTP